MFIRHNLFGIIWAGIILVLTLMPGDAMPKVWDWGLLGFDTFAHFFVFGVFVFLFITGFSKQSAFVALQLFPVSYAIILGIAFGIMIEIMQGLIPGRYFETFDIVANTIGCFTGWGGFCLFKRFWPIK